MPVFYFDTDDSQTAMQDFYGIELADEEKAYRVAVNTLPDLARSALPWIEPCTVSVCVRDEDGYQVLKASLRLVVEWA